MNYDPEECIAALLGATDLESLKEKWFALPEEARKDNAVETVKDERKATLTAEYDRHRTYRSREFPSREAGVEDSVARIYWGGSLEKPDAACTCKAWKAEKWCEHIDRLWNDELTGFQRQLVIHHYEMYERLGIKNKA